MESRSVDSKILMSEYRLETKRKNKSLAEYKLQMIEAIFP